MLIKAQKKERAEQKAKQSESAPVAAIGQQKLVGREQKKETIEAPQNGADGLMENLMSNFISKGNRKRR